MIKILLATYNGEKYLKEQLDSLFSQTYKNFEVIARDDMSTDNTFEILKSYNVKILKSKENFGAKGSFSTLLEYAVKNSDTGYFMFCDQDDIWEKDKIEKTIKKMQELEEKNDNTPLLVHTDLKVVNETLKTIDNSFWQHEHIDSSTNQFNRLLMQNTITGCTMMINRKLAELCLPVHQDSIMHDWWIGLVASKFGKIDYIDEPTIKYRQHSCNVIGSNGFTFKYIVNNIFKNDLLTKNILQARAFLDKYRDKFDIEIIKMLEEFSAIESKSWLQKIKVLLKYKLLKQGIIRNIGLLIKI